MNNLIVLTQAVTRTGVGKKLILLAVLIASLHAAGWIDAVPNKDGMPPVDCARFAAMAATSTTVVPNQQVPCPTPTATTPPTAP